MGQNPYFLINIMNFWPKMASYGSQTNQGGVKAQVWFTLRNWPGATPATRLKARVKLLTPE